MKKENTQQDMRLLNVTVNCRAVYTSSILVPKKLSLEEAIAYANAHLDEIPVTNLEYVGENEELDADNCGFDAEPMDGRMTYRLKSNLPGEQPCILQAPYALSIGEQSILIELARNALYAKEESYQKDLEVQEQTGAPLPEHPNPGVWSSDVKQKICDEFLRRAKVQLRICDDARTYDETLLILL